MTTAPAALRAQFRDTIMLRGVDGALAVAPSTAIATLYEVGSDTVLAATIYADESSSHQLPNPVPTGPNGMLEFWLDTERELDIVVTCPGFSTVRATVTADSAGGKLVNPVIEGTIYGTPIWDSPQNITISQPAQPFIDHGTLNQLAVGDPHPQYLTAAEGDALFLTKAEADALYTPAGAGYLTQAAADALYVNVSGDTMSGGLTVPSVNTPLLAPTANVIEQRNGTNLQRLSIYGGYTDASNYERVSIVGGGGPASVLFEPLGTGTNRTMVIGNAGSGVFNLRQGGTDRWQINPHLVAVTDNTIDIGAPGASRPRSIYAGTSVVAPSLIGGSLNPITIGDGGATSIAANSFGDLTFQTNSSTRWKIDFSGHLLTGIDNAYDIGASGVTGRPRTIYAGTSVVTPLVDAPIQMSSTNVVEQRNGTNAQSLWVYNTYTDGSNWERFGLRATASTSDLVVQRLGTGAARPLRISNETNAEIRFFTNNLLRWSIWSDGTLFPLSADNTLDIGQLGANRPRSIYIGTSVVTPVALLTSYLQQATIATPASPAAGSLRLYPKADGNYYKLDSAGVETVLGGGAAANGIPVGGTTGQVLQKNSATNYDAGWVTLAGGGAVPDPLILTQYVRAAAGYQIVDDNHGLYYLGGNVTELREYGGVWQLRRGIAASGATGRLSLEAQDLFSISGALTQPQIAKPASPAAGYVRIYPKADGQFYRLVSDGTETLIGGGGGGLTLPLSQNLTFSPDNTYDIGTNATTARPRDAFIGRNLQVSGVIGAGMAPVAGQAITIQSNALFAWFDTNHYLQAGSANDMLFHEWGGSWTFRADFADARAKVRARIKDTSFSLYGNWTDASNYERFYLEQAGGGAFRINSGKLGSGLVRDIEIGTADQSNWRFTGGHILAVNDNVSDIGASATTRPRSIYAATSFVGPGAVPTGGTTSQVLQKTSATNYAVGWATPSDPALRTYVGHVMGGIDAGAAPTLMGGESITTFGVTLFSDSFTRADSSTIGNGWTENSGNWEIVSNAVREPTSSGAALLINSATFATADYAVQATITQGAMVSTPTTGMGVCARMVDANNYYLAWILDQGTHVDLYRVQSGSYNLLQEWTQTALADPVILRLECQGTAIRVLVNGVTRISVTDAAFSAAGSIALRTYAGASFTNHRFDDIQVVDFAAPANSLMVWPGAGGAIGLAGWTDTGGHLLPTASATSDIGSATYQARDLFLSRNLTVGAAATIANGLTVTAGAVNLPSGAVNNTELASDTARANLLANPGFEVWSRGNGPFTVQGYFADRWRFSGGVTSTSKDTTSPSVASAACAIVFTAASTFYVVQDIENRKAFAARTVTFSMAVWSNVATAIRLYCYDGVAEYWGAYHPGDSTYKVLTLTVNLPTTVSSVLMFGVTGAAAGTYYLDNATLVVGSVAADYAPLHPVDDVNRCFAYYQRWNNPGAAGASHAAGVMLGTGRAQMLMPLKTAFRGTPTLTYSALADFGINGGNAAAVCSAIAMPYFHENHAALDCTTATSPFAIGGAALFYNFTATGFLALEWNP